MTGCYSLHPTENKAVSDDGSECISYHPTENKFKKTGGGGGGGGDSVKTINTKKPDANGNYTITAEDIPTATTTTKGGAPFATSDETIQGQVDSKIVTPKTLSDKLGEQTAGKFYQGNGPDKPGQWVDLPTPPAASFVPIPSIRFDSEKVAQVNHMHYLISPIIVNPAPLQLPERGQFKQDDEIEVLNVSGSTFKVYIKAGSDVIIRYDDQTIEDIDGKFLLSEGPGSYIRLKAENTQLWVVVERNRVTVSAGG